MSINPAQLPGRLRQDLAPAYLLAGEEPLLLEEAADALRSKARAEGYDEREVLYVDARFDWDLLRQSGENLSLFSSRRILEVRLGDKGPGTEGATALGAWLEDPVPDTLLLVHTGKLEWRARKTAWFTAFEHKGVAVYAEPVKLEALPGFIEARLKTAGLEASEESVELLALRTEGNLLACAQEIEKLKLLCPDGRVTPERVMEATADSARFEAFDLVDKALLGRAAPALQALNRLREEGVDIVPVAAALAYALRQLYQAARRVAAGQPAEAALVAIFIKGRRQKPYLPALRRVQSEEALDLIRDIAWIDRAAKGVAPAEPWAELVKLVARLSGLPMRATRPA